MHVDNCEGKAGSDDQGGNYDGADTDDVIPDGVYKGALRGRVAHRRILVNRMRWHLNRTESLSKVRKSGS